MTLAVIPFALVRMYRSTGVPSAVVPKSTFWMPAAILPESFGRGSAATPGAHKAEKTEIMTPPHIPDVCMDRLPVCEFPVRTCQGQSRKNAAREPLPSSFVPADDGSEKTG